MRYLIPVMLLGLAACANEVPNSALQQQGVGFGSYSDYTRSSARRDAQLSGSQIATGPVISTERSGAMQPSMTASLGAPVATTPLGAALPEGGVETAALSVPGNPSISDEQNFEAVSNRETIQSDAERLRQQRAAYEVVQPGVVPERPKDTGPNIVAYALSTSNGVGQQVYRRSSVNAQARYERACAGYGSSDKAQEAFLEMGGPENDRKGMDPDGDGFACTWDPSPFRVAGR